MFQEALQFHSTIMLCYNKHTIMRVISSVPPLLTWYISQIIVDCFSLIVSIYVLNYSCGHWLFNGVYTLLFP